MYNDDHSTEKNGRIEEIPRQSVLDSFLITIRIVASVGATGAIVIGVVLAIQLFSFFRGIIEEPNRVISAWQQAMEHGRSSALPAVAESSVDVEQPVGAVSVVLGQEGTSAEDEPEVDSLQEEPVTVKTEAAAAKQVDVFDEDLPPFVALADRIMERLELGEFSWLIGVGVLAVFCCLLVKIPAMLITMGTRLLLGLVNVSAES